MERVAAAGMLLAGNGGGWMEADLSHLHGCEGYSDDLANVLAEDRLPESCSECGVCVSDAHGFQNRLSRKYARDCAAESLDCVPYLKKAGKEHI